MNTKEINEKFEELDRKLIYMFIAMLICIAFSFFLFHMETEDNESNFEVEDYVDKIQVDNVNVYFNETKLFEMIKQEMEERQ